MVKYVKYYFYTETTHCIALSAFTLIARRVQAIPHEIVKPCTPGLNAPLLFGGKSGARFSVVVPAVSDTLGEAPCVEIADCPVVQLYIYDNSHLGLNLRVVADQPSHLLLDCRHFFGALPHFLDNMLSPRRNLR